MRIMVKYFVQFLKILLISKRGSLVRILVPELTINDKETIYSIKTNKIKLYFFGHF